MAHPPETLRVLRLAGLGAWALVSAPAVIEGARMSPAFAAWAGSLMAFGGLFAWSTARPWPVAWTLGALAAQSACVIVMVATQCRGLEGTLLVLVAMQLGLVVSRRAGLAWIVAQSAALGWAIQHHWSPRPALLFTPPYLGFQVVAFLVLELLGREARARAALSRAHGELLSTRELLAESARLGERLRIARELHDAMGHHLAALSLQIEVLARDGAPPALVTARMLTRRLLDDVESVVATLNRDRGVDLSGSLAALVAEIPRPRIHVDAEPVALPDPERAHALLRCCQEIVTNAVKHAGAANVWISLRVRDGLVELTARDDGAGATRLAPGQGLLGMQRRLEEVGGALHLETEPGGGFRVRATMPARPPA